MVMYHSMMELVIKPKNYRHLLEKCSMAMNGLSLAQDIICLLVLLFLIQILFLDSLLKSIMVMKSMISNFVYQKHHKHIIYFQSIVQMLSIDKLDFVLAILVQNLKETVTLMINVKEVSNVD